MPTACHMEQSASHEVSLPYNVLGQFRESLLQRTTGGSAVREIESPGQQEKRRGNLLLQVEVQPLQAQAHTHTHTHTPV